MRLLAIDTALAACSAIVFDSNKGVIASESLPMVRGHAEALLPLVERVIANAAVEFIELDRIVVTVGPGSFTGLRVGVSAARGIALAAGKPAVGITTLRAFAMPHTGAGREGTILACIDARHDHVYFQPFDAMGDALDEARIILARDVASAAPEGRVRIVGNAGKMIDAVWPTERTEPIITQTDAPDIVWVARLGARNELAHEFPKPFYLRAPEARPPAPTTLIQQPS
ncbi:MAG: tRNA (adenosine(37)-N6)-threonylcarbamoyltransferase complex dimerization subunit type 1 TsaB [Xanthobacteraceae bacterium]